MMDPMHLWDPHGCLAHRPVFQFIRQAIEIYGIPYAAPPSRTDVRFSPLLRKDVRIRVAYSLYYDESELNAALEGIFAVQAAFEQRNGSSKTSLGSTGVYHSPPERIREISQVSPNTVADRTVRPLGNVYEVNRNVTATAVSVKMKTTVHRTVDPLGDDPGDYGEESDPQHISRRDGLNRPDNQNDFDGPPEPPGNDGSSLGGQSVAEEAIVELRNLFQEKWQQDASDKEEQRRSRSDVARQKASQAISAAFREKTFTSSLGQNLLEFIERFEAICESNAIAAEFKSSMIHFMLSDAPLRAYNVTIKPYKETYAERIDALKGLFLSPDAAQRSLQQRDSLKFNDFLPQNIPPWDQERHRESFGKLADQIQDLTTRCPPGFNEAIHATQCLRVALERYDWAKGPIGRLIDNPTYTQFVMNCALALHQHCAQQKAAHTQSPPSNQLFVEEQDIMYQKPLAQSQYGMIRRNKKGIAFPAHLRGRTNVRKHFDPITGKNRKDRKGDIMKCHDCGSDSHVAYEKMCKIEDVMRHHYVRSQNGERLSNIYFEHLEGLYDSGSTSNDITTSSDGAEEFQEDTTEVDENNTFLSLIEQRYAHTLSGVIDQEHNQNGSH
jgi:hypothetical protein